ncbi:MAG: hypothetical protein EA402_03105 [Planctomycetota bacterium]|nr:MAG: hypothetical protein EA402_03105 [Planctomycetota bacterium]
MKPLPHYHLPASRRRRGIFTACLLALGNLPLLVAGEVQHRDVVVLTNGHQITGRVAEASPQSVLIEQEHGEVRLPRQLVQAVHLGFTSRLERLDRSDYEAVIALAVWAKDRGLLAEAFSLAELAWGLPQRDGRAALLLAQLLDAQAGKQREALEYYRAWRDRHGGSERSVMARIEDLERHFRSYEEALAAYQQQLASARENHVEGLEARDGWQGDDPQHANQVEVTQRSIEEHGIENVILEVQYQGGSQDKAVVRRRVTFDASQAQTIRFEVSNPGEHPIPVSLAVKAGPGYTYYESTTVTVPPRSGWHPVSFSLTSQDWKSEASNWAHNTTIGTANNVRELQIQFHNRRRDGTVYLDAIPILRP